MLKARRNAIARAKEQRAAEREREKRALASLVGRRVRVYWPEDDAFYPGTVTKYDARGAGKHHVRYDDGDEEALALHR